MTFVAFLFWTICSAQETQDFNHVLQSLLNGRIHDGQVDYEGVCEDADQMDTLLKWASEIALETLDLPEQKSLILNVYNLSVIRNVCQYRPAASTQEIADFFTKALVTLDGKLWSIDDLEKKLLFDLHDDPRLHFALVCAALGCPPIEEEVFTAQNIERKLELLTRKVCNNTAFVEDEQWRGEVELSKIFLWYKADFEKSGGKKLIEYINAYRADSISVSSKIKWKKYNWELNDLNKPTRAADRPLMNQYRVSSLMAPGMNEMKVFNNLYTQKNYDGFSTFNTRSSFFSIFIQYLHGVNESVNIGVDLVYKSNVVNDLADGSPFEVFKLTEGSTFQIRGDDTLRSAGNAPIETNRQHGMSHFGPKIKFNPVKKFKSLSLQQTVYIPLDTDTDGSYISYTQLFFDRPVGSKYQVFAEASLWWPFADNREWDSFFKVFVSYFPNDRLTTYVMSTIPYEFGVGVKYYILPAVELELLYTKYLSIDRFVAPGTKPETYNLGVRTTF